MTILFASCSIFSFSLYIVNLFLASSLRIYNQSIYQSKNYL